MSSSKPPATPPTGGVYKRPSFPDLAAQRASTDALRAQLDRHAAHEGIVIRRPVPPARLASTIRQAIDRRELQGAAARDPRGEITRAFEALHEGPYDPIKGDLFLETARAYLASLAEPDSCDRMRAMRESVQRLNVLLGVNV